MAYATSAEYTTYTGQTAPTDIDLLLTRASRLVDQALLAAVYEVDEDGLPVDTVLLAALRDATCEQTSTWVATGEDGTGATAEYANVSIGSVTLGRASKSGEASRGSAATRLTAQAWMILQQVGLTGHGPWTY